MANEALLRIETEFPINFNVPNATGVEKGTIMSLVDELACSGAATANCYVAGISSGEKIASNGQTYIGVYRRGYFDMVASGAINIGRAVSSASDANYPNTVKEAAVTVSGAAIIGHSLAAATDAERVLIAVDIGAGGNHIS